MNCLNVCQEIEHELGRVREVRWGPRTVDLDILLYNNDNIEAENLIVPHPRMHERAFVLIPLLEIASFYCPSGDRKVIFGGSCCPRQWCCTLEEELTESNISCNEGMKRLQLYTLVKIRHYACERKEEN